MWCKNTDDQTAVSVEGITCQSVVSEGMLLVNLMASNSHYFAMFFRVTRVMMPKRNRTYFCDRAMMN